MKGDSIVIEPHHKLAADQAFDHLRSFLIHSDDRKVIAIAGESGSGKSETAAALALRLEAEDIHAAVLQQDDYFVYPPRSNDRARRKDINWVGPNEVHLDLLDRHLADFRSGSSIDKPLVDYAADRIDQERIDLSDARVLIVEGTYTLLLYNVDWRIFIDRSYLRTRAHREKRIRDASELDPFIDRVLEIEHDIISKHRARADLLVNDDYTVSWGPAGRPFNKPAGAEHPAADRP